ncbi:MAG: ABC transporter substrate-binding protein [Chloroflexi bacterium]|nr:ABC transporter substrate-binding protein [Chloroflexota bacterium]
MSRKLRIGPACYHTLHLLPPMVAHDMNFFYEEGLHDEFGNRSYELVTGGLSPFGWEKETLPRAMFDKGMDIAMDVLPTTVLLARQHGQDIYIIAGWRNQQPSWLVGAPDIKEPRQLKGKRIAVRDQGSIQWRALCGALVRAGLNPDTDVTFVDRVLYGEVPQTIAAGKVDAGMTLDLEGVKAHGLNLLDNIAKHYPDGRPDRIIAATGKVLRDHPDLVQAYLRATIRAYWFIRKQPENLTYLAGLAHRMAVDSPNEEEKQWWRFPESTAEKYAGMPFPIDGMPTGFQQYFEEQVKIGEIKEIGEWNQILMLEPAREAYHELVARPELKAEATRAKDVAASFGY